jgi:hypothetical protein
VKYSSWLVLVLVVLERTSLVHTMVEVLEVLGL